MKNHFVLLIVALAFFSLGYSVMGFSRKDMSHAGLDKKEWMESCNKIKNSLDHIKINTVNRCLGACDKIVNAKVKDKTLREENFKNCTTECQKAKSDIFEDVFSIERRIDEKIKCHYSY
jgi:hypothetical protein